MPALQRTARAVVALESSARRFALPTWVRRRARASFDHFVGARQQRGRHGDAERPGGLEVDDQLNPGWLLDRQVRRFCAFKDASKVDADLVGHLVEARAIADQATIYDKIAHIIHRQNSMAGSRPDQLLILDIEQGIVADKESS